MDPETKHSPMNTSEKNRSKAFILNDFKAINKNEQNEHFSVGLDDDNIYCWRVMIFGPRDTLFEGGVFRAVINFPMEYPEEPPTFRFITPMWHPNIDTNGNVCISILHKPGDDAFEYESIDERWLPVRSAESVIVSIVSLLSSPNYESAANLDAGNQYRTDIKAYIRTVKAYVQKSSEYL